MMINDSLMDQMASKHENITDYLGKAEALISIALSAEFREYPPATIQAYLCVVRDILSQAMTVNEDVISILLHNF